ncbi:vegetative incompatibility protein HET-E-1 [Beauveria bassiana ARSEF 2860]|uniref:Vegetative incompatibility protein HET-E-1 n=1 Tax=Beauveria bassiana (strain ARSEF 2860) TaxID=655819 RepID=J4UF90_BEAB2|nr:vegetative incompatibility protein HET-E-1 [Beauveria bassiana ARSEF 2860]EJP61137.1 vegetative incompatibility protein HET-E-1 [Beauveria bassiana ARSEF 2860]
MEHSITLWATVLVLLLTSALLFPTIIKLHRRGTANRVDGLYVISEPENGGEASFEIVAVHGLGAHPEKTWTSQAPSRSTNSEERSRVHLLRDLLKHDFPKARILAFAHNSDWLMNAPVTTAQLIGERLLDGLVKHRRKHRCVPIVFIGHSFGGIIIKEALCKSGEDTKEIVDSTSGILFLGTPHQGSPMSLFGILAARISSVFGSSMGLLLSLSSHRDKLSDLDERFDECMKMKEGRRQRTEIVALREAKPTRMFGWLSIGLVVPRDSARGSHGAITIDIDTDHSGLNKCKTTEDKLYINLKQVLTRLKATTAPTLNGNQKFVVGNLRTVEEAAFDSHANEQVATCLENTRHELLKAIMDWSNDQTDEHVYWLQGKAGTGKSTIARTMAADLSAKGRLGGSFFFKRTESDRSNAGRLFTTIAVQLAERLPSVAGYVRNVIEADPTISAKGLGEQFRKLIQHPVKAAQQTLSKPMTVVIDALDECETDQDVTTIIKLLLQSDLRQAGPLKFLITSRYEPPIRLGFSDSHGKFIEFPLHEIPPRMIERGIAIFLKFRICEIRRQHNIATSWPSQAMLEDLLKRSVPLFISAATACRFIEDNRQGEGGPDSRLRQILQHEAYGDFDQTYMPILNQMVQGLKGTSRRNAITEFKKIVGSIVTLSSPLGVISLANLLGIAVERVDNRLQMFHSVLDIPTDSTAPVRIFHESFREYLVHSDPEDKHQFWVDEKATHNMLAERCLRLLSENGRLKQDICGLAAPGKTRFSVGKHQIDHCLPPEVQYATLYWVRHLKGSGAKLCDGHQVLQFLQCYFLHWLEALSLIGRISEGIGLIGELQSLIESHSSTKTSHFLRDANRFILNYRSIIDQSPLQLYASTLIFAPETSIIRNLFHNDTGQVSAKAIVEQNWSACLQTLEGHSRWPRVWTLNLFLTQKCANGRRTLAENPLAYARAARPSISRIHGPRAELGQDPLPQWLVSNRLAGGHSKRRHY